MKATIQTIISIVSNWRIDALTLLFALVLLLAMAESDSVPMLITSKIFAVILGYLASKLAKTWDRIGYLKELDVLNDNQEED